MRKKTYSKPTVQVICYSTYEIMGMGIGGSGDADPSDGVGTGDNAKQTIFDDWGEWFDNPWDELASDPSDDWESQLAQE